MKAKRIYGLALFLVSLVLITAFSSAVYAKYIKKTDFSGNVTIQADLAKDFKIVESEVSRNELGEYSLISGTETSENDYILMPGVDIPKDPTIKITGKTALPAYLYVEVVDTNTDSAIKYDMADRWQLLAGVTGPNGGKVYVYNETVDGSTANMEVQLIKGNTVYVGQTLVHSAAAKPFSIKFHAYLLQKPDGTTNETAIFKNALGLS
jgi:hypothetical protein